MSYSSFISLFVGVLSILFVGVLNILFAILVYLDAKKRDELYADGWAIFTFLVWIVALPLYYLSVVRKSEPKEIPFANNWTKVKESYKINLPMGFLDSGWVNCKACNRKIHGGNECYFIRGIGYFHLECDPTTFLKSATDLPSEEATQPIPKNLKFCLFCGEKIPSIAEFCDKCGKKQ